VRGLFESFRLTSQKPVREQIGEQLRALILDGQLLPGEQVPSTDALAKIWHTNVSTVHAAMIELGKEGLLDRRQGKGTFVRRRDQRLEKVAIYYPSRMFGDEGDPFQRALFGALHHLLQKRDIHVDLMVDPRSPADQAAAWRPLVAAIRQRRIQGLIVPAVDLPHLHWLRKLAIPSALATLEDLPNIVGFDHQQLFDLALGRLAEQGCRSVGLITPHPTDSAVLSGGVHRYVNYYDEFLATARRLGLAVRNEWMRAPRGPHTGLTGRDMPAYGRREFHALWEQPERPDGLLV
jgi:DNA-binding LacI/PurR family transcriptional regulator